MSTRPASKEHAVRAPAPPARTPPVPTQHLAELTWRICEREGEDVLILRESIVTEINATPSQFERLKGYIRDHVTMEKGKAFLAYRGGYMITADPARIAESVGWRLHRINTELRRLLSGWINPLGDRVADYDILVMYQDEIGHMLRTQERMRQAALTMPTPVKRTRRRRTSAQRPSGQ